MTNETLKQVVDAGVIGTGLAASIDVWMTYIINPILSTIVLLFTIIWMFYRIQALRKKK